MRTTPLDETAIPHGPLMNGTVCASVPAGCVGPLLVFAASGPLGESGEVGSLMFVQAVATAVAIASRASRLAVVRRESMWGLSKKVTRVTSVGGQCIQERTQA